MQIRHKLFSAVSWRVEARAAGLSPGEGQRVRERCGQLMRWVDAHRSLPAMTGRAAILCFHGIGDRPDPDVEAPVLDVRNFRRLLRVLKRSFRVISLAELVAAIREHRSPPSKSIVITFDDGYLNNYQIAAEELSAMKMAWSEFLPAMLVETGSRQWVDDVRVLIHRGHKRHLSLHWQGEELELDLSTQAKRREAVARIEQQCRYIPEDVRQPRLAELYAHYSSDEIETLRNQYPSFAPMTWEQARELKTSGVDVGSHAMWHIALSQQTPERLRHEIITARDLLQKRIGDHSPHFSYPYGRPSSMSAATESVLNEMGYHCALTLEQEVIRTAEQNLMQLPRLIVSPTIGRVLFGLWQRFNT